MSHIEQNGSPFRQYLQEHEYRNKQQPETMNKAINNKTVNSKASSSSSSTQAANDDTIDVFEYEPAGFMSRGRW